MIYLILKFENDKILKCNCSAIKYRKNCIDILKNKHFMVRFSNFMATMRSKCHMAGYRGMSSDCNEVHAEKEETKGF